MVTTHLKWIMYRESRAQLDITTVRAGYPLVTLSNL